MANWIGHNLCRNCFLKHFIEGKIEGRIKVTGRRGRRSSQLLDDLKETRGFWKQQEEAPDLTGWRTRFGRCCRFGVNNRYDVFSQEISSCIVIRLNFPNALFLCLVPVAWPACPLTIDCDIINFLMQFSPTAYSSFPNSTFFSEGDRGSTVVKVRCYKSDGRWFHPSWCQWRFSLT